MLQESKRCTEGKPRPHQRRSRTGSVRQPHLFVERVQHALTCPIAVPLVWEQHQPHARPVSLQSRVETLALQRVGARVVVLLHTSMCFTRQDICQQIWSGGGTHTTSDVGWPYPSTLAAMGGQERKGSVAHRSVCDRTSPWISSNGFLMRSANLRAA